MGWVTEWRLSQRNSYEWGCRVTVTMKSQYKLSLSRRGLNFTHFYYFSLITYNFPLTSIFTKLKISEREKK